MNDVQAAYCAKCGAPQPGAPAPAASAAASAAPPLATSPAPAYSPVPYAPVAPRAVGYGGFWIRFVAAIIDYLVLRVAMIPFGLLIFGRLMLVGGWFPRGGRMSPDEMFPFMAAAGKLFLIQTAAYWIYEAWMTSSSKQATLGKMAFGLKVVNAENGAPLSFALASGRHFAKYISAFTAMIGFIIAGFTARKQALHDLIAGTVVIKTTT
jgi:uncharacterized RDD family membrane protein YckC